MTQLNPTLQDLRTHMVRDIDRQLHEFQGSTDRGSSSFSWHLCSNGPVSA